MIHITNGDSTANKLHEAHLAGFILPMREALAMGPAHETAGRDEWLAMRARFLGDEYGVDPSTTLTELRQQETAIDSVVTHDEATLWFEHDLFCQINLIYLLSRLYDLPPSAAKLTIVMIDSFPGIEPFHGLGQLSADDLASLLPERRAISDEMLRLGADAWSAYCSTDPAAVERFIAEELSSDTPLPYLRDALIRHLSRFPSTFNGLGAVEQMVMELIGAEAGTFTRLFNRFASAASGFGYGDWQLWCDLVRLAHAHTPLITIEGVEGNGQPLTSGAFRDATFALTDAGREVLAGRTDAVALNGIDRWIGGAHLLAGEGLRRWDRERERLVEMAA